MSASEVAAPTLTNSGPPATTNSLLHRELWSSWAGVLRSYAAVHSLGRSLHAIVEVSSDEILLRYGPAWLRFHADRIDRSDGSASTFYLTVNGQAVIDGEQEEMDLAAERLCREIIVA